MDLTAKLPALLPAAIRWAEERAEEVVLAGQPLDERDLALARAVGVREPERIRVRLVDDIGLPDDPELRAAALEAGLLGPGTAGLTLGYSVLIRRGQDSAHLRSHEFRHVSQYEGAGSIAEFLPVYLGQIVSFGYHDAPLEVDARRHERGRVTSAVRGPTQLRVLIDGVDISSEEIGPPAMNYGQLHRWERFKRVHYEYRIAWSVFLEYVGPWFDRCRAELRADDVEHSPQARTGAQEFAALGYPPLSEVLASYPEVAERLLLDVPLELNNLFAPARSDRIRYAANTVDLLSVGDGVVRFGGLAFDLSAASDGATRDANPG